MASMGASLAVASMVTSPRPGTSPQERAAASRPVPVVPARATARRPSAEDEAALLASCSPYEAAAEFYGSASLGSARNGGSLSSSLQRSGARRSASASPAAASVVGFAGAASPQSLKPPVPGVTRPARPVPGLLQRELSNRDQATPAEPVAPAEAASRKAVAAERGARPDERTARVSGHESEGLWDDRL